jgi:hypothetical protein
MATDDSPTRDRIIALLDTLPDEALAEVVSFLEFQRAKSAHRPTDNPPYLPTPMGGLWRGVSITEADIAEARREMWGRFAEGAP